MLRTLRVAASGLLTGLLTSILGAVTFVSATVWDYRRRMSDTTDEPPYLSALWSALTDQRALPFWAALVAVFAMNSGIGAWAGSRGSRRAAPVTVVPILLVLCALAYWVLGPSNPKSWVFELFIVAFVVLFVWVAGRLGQEVGWWQRLAEPSAAPDPARVQPSGDS
jgi:hypothetical protein